MLFIILLNSCVYELLPYVNNFGSKEINLTYQRQRKYFDMTFPVQNATYF